MKKYLFMQNVLKFIDKGTLFTLLFSSLLRVLALLLTIGALIGWMQVWKFVFQMPGAAILGGFLFQMLYVIAIYMVVHTILIRARDIQTIGKSDFIIIPIVTILLRMLGEIYASISISVGVGGAILELFVGYSGLLSFAAGSIPGISTVDRLVGSNSSFITALVLIFTGIMGAAFWLILFYFSAESISAWVDIARNTRAIRDTIETRNESDIRYND